MTGPVSGKKTVFLLALGALLLCGLLFSVALREKRHRFESSSLFPHESADTATSDAALHSFLDSLPREWTRISRVEGQGWVVFVPCDSQIGVLHLAADSARHPALQCEFCDSLTEARVTRALRFNADGRIDLALSSQGSATVERVGDEMAARFAGAPVQGYVLTWMPSPHDSLTFIPSASAAEFETLRADDENPEGCAGGKP